MEYLNDDNLEELGIIKEINTLSIIDKSNRKKEKRYKKVLILCFVLMMIISLVGQILFMNLFGGMKLMKLAIAIYMVVSVSIALILIEMGEKNLC